MPQTALKSKAEVANQRNAVLAGFLGWTLDAFDFFILTLVIDDVARRRSARRGRDIALTITLALAMRPLGALIFGIMADRSGRRLPLMLNVIFYADHLGALGPRAELRRRSSLLRMLFGIGMGGEWGVGASLALESASPRLRGLLSGLLQEGYAIGNLLAAARVPLAVPVFDSRIPADGWRVMFFIGGLPALLSLFIRAKVKESEAWHEHRTDWADLPAVDPAALAAASCISSLLMTMMNFMSHGTQDMYPTLLQRSVGFAPDADRATSR